MYEATLNEKLLNLSELTKEEIQRLKQKKLTFYCQQCQKQVLLKAGAIKLPHFAHITLCENVSMGESDEHKQGKALMYEWVKALHPDDVMLEYSLPSIKRTADLFFELNQQKYVIEIQKSLISKAELDTRTRDYESLNMIPIWIFITPIKQKKQSLYMSPLMQKQKHQPLLYLNVNTKKLTIYNHCLWLTKSECLSSSQPQALKDVTLSQLCETTFKSFYISKEKWLDYKKSFRLSKWYYYLKQNYALRTLCAKHRLSLSLIGVEVGWPIQQCGGFVEPLMLWQSVVSCCLRDYDCHDFFTSSELLYRIRYFLKASKQQPTPLLHAELVEYLKQLVQLQLLSEEGGYYQVVQPFKVFTRLEEANDADQQASDVMLYLT